MTTDIPASCILTYDADAGEVRQKVRKAHSVLGRSDDCDVVLPFEAISRRHATLEWQEAGWTVRDLDSMNGVFVNGSKVSQAVLHENDRIRIGTIEVTFGFDNEIPSGTEPRVVIRDTDEISMATAFRMTDFDPFGAVSNPSHPPPERPPSAKAPTTDTAEATWVFDVMKKATETMIRCDKLEDLLENLMDLAFELMPAQRGAICLYDPSSDELTPNAARVRLDGSTEEVSISRAIADEVIKHQQSVLVEDVMTHDVFRASETLLSRGVRSAICAPFFRDGHTTGLIYLDTRSKKGAFTEHDLRVLSTIALIGAMAVQQCRLRDHVAREHQVRERLARYFSPRVVDRIVLTGDTDARALSAEEREITVLFCDLHRFTHLSESMGPSEITSLLNNVFTELAEIVFRLDGTLDKFTGDGLIAVFGAPFNQPDHASRAIRAALKMRAAIAEIDADQDLPLPLAMRFGINTGTVVAGDIGATHCRQYTVIGDTVNVASRLESVVARPGEIIIGPETRAHVHESFVLGELETVDLPGRVEPIKPYRVDGRVEDDTDEGRAALKTEKHEA